MEATTNLKLKPKQAYRVKPRVCAGLQPATVISPISTEIEHKEEVEDGYTNSFSNTRHYGNC